MTRFVSPLRYPGGKTCLYTLAATVLRENRLERGHYIEPYAGGCGLALSLLYGGHVSDIHINDLDPSVWCFWDSVLNGTDQLVRLIERTPVTIKEWYHQRDIHGVAHTGNPLELGFATFFLNRTNRSGVIKGAGVIGGLNQEGNYKIDCRFNREDLVRRVKRVAKYRSRIHLSNLDAIPFMKSIDKEIPATSFFCIDPPYYSKGSSLYTNFYGADEHEKVSRTVLSLRHPWIVTYDDVEEIRGIYHKRRQFPIAINYSIQTKRIGSELLIASKGLRIPSEVRDGTFVAAEFAMAS
jgi:DNA adenine methylase